MFILIELMADRDLAYGIMVGVSGRKANPSVGLGMRNFIEDSYLSTNLMNESKDLAPRNIQARSVLQYFISALCLN